MTNFSFDDFISIIQIYTNQNNNMILNCKQKLQFWDSILYSYIIIIVLIVYIICFLFEVHLTSFNIK
jgi:hypothetical protein